MRAELRRDALKPGARWRWLDGPPEFRSPGQSLNALARVLVTEYRAPLAYAKWGCVLRWEDRPPRREDRGAARAVRWYELSSWHRDLADGESGDDLDRPSPVVETAKLSRLDQRGDPAQIDERNMRYALCRLLDKAGAALEAID